MAEFIQIWSRMADSSTPQHRKNRLKLTELNPHLICILCGGYYIDATTIVECLHTFCKTCIVGYLGMSKHCPACDTLVHKSKPLLRLRPDHTLQDLVYKLVPGLFKDEMKKRRNFYKEEIESGKIDDCPSADARERIIYSPDDKISLALEISTDGRPPVSTPNKSGKEKGMRDCRYLQCPAALTIGHLKKFIRMKFNLCEKYQIDLFHTDEALRDSYSLMDVAYIYSWRRKGPLRLFYTVYTTPPRQPKPAIVPDANRIVIQELVNDIISKTKETVVAIPVDSNTQDVKTGETDSVPKDIICESDKMVVETKTIAETEDQKILTDAKKMVQNKLKRDSRTEGNEDEITLEKTVDKTNSETNIMNYSVTTEHTNDNTGTVESNSDKVIESTSDDSGNFSLNESFDNSVSDFKSESDDTEKTESTKAAVHVKKIPEVKESVCNEKPDENMNSQKDELHDEVFTDNRNLATKSNSQVEESIKCDTKNTNKSNTDSLENRKRLIDDTCKTNPDKEEHFNVSETVECSTSTSDLDTSKSPVSSSVSSKPRVYGKDDLVSEPIVSSTQNTQGCQTDDGETDIPKAVGIGEKEDDITTSNNESIGLRIDVSCETENFETERRTSKESVSVSTDTEELAKESGKKRKSVDSATSTDIPYKSARRGSADSGSNTEFHDKLVKPLSPRKLSPNPAIMEAQPLSPTKITLKLTSAPTTVKRPNHSPSRSDPTSSTFLSKFESFVSEMPDTSQDFEPPYTTSPRPSTGALTASVKLQEKTKPTIAEPLKISEMIQDSSEKKSITALTVKRPRGRPPKNKSTETYVVTNQKVRKSRSNSPKYKKYERQKSESFAVASKTNSSLLVSDCSDPKRRKHNSEKSETTSVGQKEERKIPKHFVLFSNGKYTLATENNISKFKQSSPVSPTRTVWDTVLSSYGDKGKYSKSSGSVTKKHDNKTEKKVENPSELSRLSSQDALQPKLKPLRIVISEPLPVVSKHFTESSVSAKDKPRMTNSGLKKDFSVSGTLASVHASDINAFTSEKVLKMDANDSLAVSKVTSSVDANLATSQNTTVRASTTISSGPLTSSSSNVAKSVKTLQSPKRASPTTASKNSVSSSSVSKTMTTSNSILPITVPLLSFNQSKELPSPKDNKVIKAPEYRHQSPFFASLSGAKLTSPHRPSAHLNIPNLKSHFAGSHYLYAQNSYRYTNDRLGCPSYRSLPGLGSTEAKAVGMGLGSVTAKTHRDIVTSHSVMIPPFISPLSIPSMLHLPATQSLPFTNNTQSLSSKGHSPDSTRCHMPIRPDMHHAFNVPLNSASNVKIPKQNSAARKTKEKSIDNVISAITERAKKEIGLNEQLTGMDLSMKNMNSHVQTPVENPNDTTVKYKEKDKVVSNKTCDKGVDKWAFTDEDESPSNRPSLHLKHAISDQKQ